MLVYTTSGGLNVVKMDKERESCWVAETSTGKTSGGSI
jgi:hypothetical protein